MSDILRIAAWCLQQLDRVMWGGGLALGLVCAGCDSLPQTAKVDFVESTAAPVVAMAAAPEKYNSGSLFHSASYRPAFEDHRARAVGDIITVQIVEKVTASQVSKSTANRTTSGSASVSANDFSGKGGTESANTFSGSITATVVNVLPNGHLLVTGEKQIGVNQHVDVLRFSGTVDPRLMQAGNIVNSTQVANVRLESKGRGAQAEAQTVGWLTRFFFSFLPF